MDVYITRLRKYLRKDPAVKILNVHGRGYKLIYLKNYPDFIIFDQSKKYRFIDCISQVLELPEMPVEELQHFLPASSVFSLSSVSQEVFFSL